MNRGEAKFSLIEPNIQDFRATLKRNESKAKRDSGDASTVKILLLGLDGVGKSSIIFKFLFDFFPEHSNVGLEEHYQKLIKYKKQSINLDIIDTNGLVSFCMPELHG